jgi:hypothetical protein
MLTLRRHSIKLSDTVDKNLFVHFYLDTEELGYLSSWDRFFRGELIIQKPWIGKVNRSKKEFKIRRAGTGIFKTGISAIEIHGKLIEAKGQRTIDIKMRPVWYAPHGLLWIAVFFGLITWSNFNDIFSWAILAAYFMLQVLFLALDLHKTDEKILEYLSHKK